MRITDYSTLVEQIVKTANHTSVTGNAEIFIQMAEKDMSTRLRDRRMETQVNLATASGKALLPDDFRNLLNIDLVGVDSALEAASRTWLDDLPAQTGTPRYYALEGDTIRFYPTPSDGTAIAIRYHAAVPDLTAQAPTNWLLGLSPQAYLYGALIHAPIYLKDDERLEVFTLQYERAISAINGQSATELNPASLSVRPSAAVV